VNRNLPPVPLVPLDPQAFEDYRLLNAGDEQLTLAGLLREQPAFSLQPLDPDLLEVPVRRLQIEYRDPDPATPLYWPPGASLAGLAPAGGDGQAPAEPEPPQPTPAGVVVAERGHPTELSDGYAVLIAHDEAISRAARFLESGLSVMIQSEKLLVEHLVDEIVGRARRRHEVLRLPKTSDAGMMAMPGARRQQLLDELLRAVRDTHQDAVVVVPHLDLLAGGSDPSLTPEARELTDVLYDTSDRILLGFTDPSLAVPEVLANRFAVRMAIDILPREVRGRNEPRADDGKGAPSLVPIGTALVRQEEAELFRGYDPNELYKHIAGMNAVRLRHAMRFVHQQYRQGGPGGEDFSTLVDALRSFKARSSTSFEVPHVSMEHDIGGYEGVKAQLTEALDLIKIAERVPKELRHELVPRGFIFHGPPGTGKTLFAKAMATSMDATISVVSGPEITDMYVGESERKLREIFSEARKNAPTVIVFDEFDSIASRRSGRDEGGARANNAMVAQLLTEMDGFRPEVPVLVIGTTNRLDIIDEALLRPSRFKPVKIDLPDEDARRKIAEVHAAHFEIPLSDALLDHLALATDKMNGDEIQSIFRDARRDAVLGKRQADARRLGELVGNLRRATQDRDLEREHSPRRTAGGRAVRQPVMTAFAGTAPGRTAQGAGGDPADHDEELEQA
jgi:transitional endoplasmic reticulum ATPase